MKRLLTFVILSFLLITSGGCTRDYSDGTPKLTLWHNEDARVIPFIKGIMDEFTKLHDNKIKLEQVHYQVENIHQQYLTASIAGSGPDIVYTQEDKAGIFVVGKFIHPVEKLVNMNNYVPVATRAVKEDGHYWGVPVSTGNHLMLFYNKSLSKQAPKTTDELIKFSKNVMEKHEGYYGLAADTMEPFFFVPFLSSFGGWPMKEREVTLNTPEMKRAMIYFKRLRDEEKIMPKECDYNCMDGLFKEGRAAFIINGDWAIDSYKKVLGKDFGIATLPINSETNLPMGPMVSGKYFMVNANIKGEQLDWAAKFIKFYTNKKNQMRQFKELGRLPGFRPAYFTAKKNSPKLMKPSFDQLLLGKPSPMYVEMRAVWDAMRSQKGAYMSGAKTADEALAFMQEIAERKVREMRVR